MTDLKERLRRVALCDFRGSAPRPVAVPRHICAQKKLAA